MKLGFSVETLLPAARVSGPMRMGLVRLAEEEWLDPQPDLGPRAAGFDAHPDAVQVLPEAEASVGELAAMLGVDGGLEACARAGWEDLCLMVQDAPGGPFRLGAAAVAFPTDWRLEEKIGRSIDVVHAPIHGYAEQLSEGVNRFMEGLRPGAIFGRTNAFVLASDALHYLPTDDPAERFGHVTADNAGEALFVRCERETLRRLPQTGAILFTIGVYRAALGSLSTAAVVRLAQSLTGYGDGEHERRAAPFYADALAGYAARRENDVEAAA